MMEFCVGTTHMHARTHARTHARMHTRTHAHTHIHRNIICDIVLCSGETTPHLIWQANPPIPNAENQYGFTSFSLTLNQPDEGRYGVNTAGVYNNFVPFMLIILFLRHQVSNRFTF